LEPAVIRGVESKGMLLAADGGDCVVILTPEKDVPSGAGIR
ncbi:MAG: methionine--tRNA ligase subunit beta, partial [Candidatus Omnitrophica bacterium CG11_big_fil_rev_8_21_14_0_20_45_26]